jgi:dipeptidyl aminopeptidase/acylaminoacyl peptidase
MSVTTGPEGPRLAIAVVDPLTGSSSEITLLDVPGVSQQYPRWSPDGRLIAYEARGEGSRWAIWVIDADGSNPRRVTQSDVHGRQPTWAPDQSTLFYRDDFQHVWRVTLDADANAIGEPERFLEMSARHRAGEGGFDVRGNRLLLAVETHAGDLWLLEFLEARRP